MKNAAADCANVGEASPDQVLPDRVGVERPGHGASQRGRSGVVEQAGGRGGWFVSVVHRLRVCTVARSLVTAGSDRLRDCAGSVASPACAPLPNKDPLRRPPNRPVLPAAGARSRRWDAGSRPRRAGSRWPPPLSRTPRCSPGADALVREATRSWPRTPRTSLEPSPKGCRPRSSTGCACRASGSTPWPPACGRSRPSPTRWARSSTAGCVPTGCASSGCASRSASSRSSTRTAQT